MLLSSRRAGTPRCGALVVPLLCCDGRDTIQGRWAGSVKDLRPRFTHTDIHAGQRHLGDLGASLRCRHWERSQASAAPSSVRTFRPGPTAWWSLVIDSTCQVCATQPRPGSPPLPPHTNCPHTPPHPGPAPPQPTAPAHRLPDRRRHGRGHSARPGARPSGRGHSTPSETAIPSPHARDAPGWKKVSPHTQNVPRHASELSETRRTLVASNAARLPLSRWHRCPRMATDSTTTVDTTVIRAALQTIVTIGDSR